MHLNPKHVGTGVAAAIAAGLGYALISGRDDHAAFKTLKRDGAFSIRDYPRLLVAETVLPGMRESALTRGFLALADYICGKDRGGARIPMTVPVLADGDEDGRGWRTRFVMPARYTQETLPAPGDEIAIRSLPARRIAAVRFAGEASDDVLDAHEDALRDWMRSHRLSAAGPVEHAFYDPPFTPGMLRRSEILIPLAA